MYKKLLPIIITLSIGILITVISGCVTNRIDLVDNGTVSVETIPSKKVNFLWIDIYQDGEDCIVYGTIQQHGYSSSPLTTHVDITTFSPEGSILQVRRTRDIHVPRRRPGKGVDWARFQERYSDIPPIGSKIQLVCHSQPHNRLKK